MEFLPTAWVLNTTTAATTTTTTITTNITTTSSTTITTTTTTTILVPPQTPLLPHYHQLSHVNSTTWRGSLWQNLFKNIQGCKFLIQKAFLSDLSTSQFASF